MLYVINYIIHNIMYRLQLWCSVQCIICNVDYTIYNIHYIDYTEYIINGTLYIVKGIQCHKTHIIIVYIHNVNV